MAGDVNGNVTKSRRRSQSCQQRARRRALWGDAGAEPVFLLSAPATPRSLQPPVTHLVGPDQGLHGQVIFHQFTGLGPAGYCRPAFRDDRKGPGLSQAVRGFLTGFPEEAVPGLGRGRNKKTAKLGTESSWVWPRLGPQATLVFLHHYSSQDLPRTLTIDPSQPTQAPIQSSDLSRTQLGRGFVGEL